MSARREPDADQVHVGLRLPADEWERIAAMAEAHGVVWAGRPNVSAMIRHMLARVDKLPKRWKP